MQIGLLSLAAVAATLVAIPSSHRLIRRTVLALVLIGGLTATLFHIQVYDRILATVATWSQGPTGAIPVGDFAPNAQPDLRIAVVGDVGTGDRAERATGRLIAETGAADHFDALVLLGDNVYPSGDPDRLDDTVFEPFGAVLDSGADLLAVLGNHDVLDGNGPGQMAALAMPGRWYATESGNLTFIGLDSTTPDDPQQLAWLESTLAAVDTRWIVVAMHHPPFSAGYHGSDLPSRDAFAPLFSAYGVDLVLSGHDHDYQRSTVIDGVTYVVTGAAAKIRPTGTDTFTAASFSTRHFVELSVWDDRLLIRAINDDGVFDQAVIGGGLTVAASDTDAADIVLAGGLLIS